jgi:hypothetical protein
MLNMVMFLFAGNAYADISDILPETAKSGAARAELNQKTSDLPSFKDVGDSLQKNLGFGDDPKNIGKAIDQNTPGMSLLGLGSLVFWKTPPTSIAPLPESSYVQL